MFRQAVRCHTSGEIMRKISVKRLVCATGAAGLLLFASAATAQLPAGWTCAGTCGSSAANGIVTLSPTGNSSYEYVTTYNGTLGVGALPTGALGSETNGSTLSTSTFSATAGTPLNFYFNYVTSDGSGYADYAWAELFNSSNTPVSLLFTARTESSGSIIPGSGLPPPNATLTPSSVPIISGAPDWAPLGTSSGTCFASGCGYTGWVLSSYDIPATGNYYLEVGVTNWIDQAYQSGLALDGVTVGGIPVGPGSSATPEPSSIFLLGSGLLGFAAFARRKLPRR